MRGIMISEHTVAKLYEEVKRKRDANTQGAKDAALMGNGHEVLKHFLQESYHEGILSVFSMINKLIEMEGEEI